MGIRITRHRRQPGQARLTTSSRGSSITSLSSGLKVSLPKAISKQKDPKPSCPKETKEELDGMLAKLKSLANQQPAAAKPALDPYAQILQELDNLTQKHLAEPMNQLQNQVQQLRAPSVREENRRRLGVLNHIISDTSANRREKLKENHLISLLDEIGIQAANRRSLHSGGISTESLHHAKSWFCFAESKNR